MVYIFHSNIMLWNQCTYEWYNSPTKYYFDLENTITFKGLRNTTFNNKNSMKFYTYIKKNHKEQSSLSNFTNFLKVMEFNQMIWKCS
jgi:cell fate regulator YaaT (PSP1 superfamily)